MTTLVSLLFLAACSKPAAPAPQAASSWAASIKPWYCGSEPLPASKDGTLRTREVVLKLAAGKDSFTGTYAHRAAGDRYIGSLTRFKSTGDRAATLYYVDDARHRGSASLVFSPDYSGVTITWEEPADGQPTSVTLSASDPASCPVASLIK